MTNSLNYGIIVDMFNYYGGLMKKYLLAAALLMGTVAMPAHASDDAKILNDASKISAASGLISAGIFVVGTAAGAPMLVTAAPFIGVAGLATGILYSIVKAEHTPYFESVLYNGGSSIITGLLAKEALQMIAGMVSSSKTNSN